MKRILAQLKQIMKDDTAADMAQVLRTFRDLNLAPDRGFRNMFQVALNSLPDEPSELELLTLAATACRWLHYRRGASAKSVT